jgi:hypothetical protein
LSLRGMSRGTSSERWAPRRRPVRLRLRRRTPVHRARVPGVPSHPALREGRIGHRREHLPSLPAPQPIRGGAGLRALAGFQSP